LAISEKVLGAEHPETATTYYNMAIVYQDQGENKTALKWFLKCYKVRRVKFGETHRFTVDVVDCMREAFDNNDHQQPFEGWLQASLE